MTDRQTNRQTDRQIDIVIANTAPNYVAWPQMQSMLELDVSYWCIRSLWSGCLEQSATISMHRDLSLCYLPFTKDSLLQFSIFYHDFIICPIAIAYSMGHIITSVCVCQCICPSASTLTVAFLDRFSPKLAQT